MFTSSSSDGRRTTPGEAEVAELRMDRPELVGRKHCAEGVLEPPSSVEREGRTQEYISDF
ncbi:hypothetical protein E2320_001283 [Naja naja]|nr:hypothetical protein E2320_001283 [Naja naja]